MVDSMKLEIDTNDEIFDEIMVATIKEARDYLADQLGIVEDGGQSVGVFSMEDEEEKELLRERVAAFDLVLDWYTA